MKLKEFFQSTLFHLLAAGVFLAVLYIYFSPVIEGKRLVQSDIVQITGSLKEANDYHNKTGEEILWSNSGFGGMPVWRGYSNNVSRYIHNAANAILPSPILLCFLSFIGFYILLQAFNINNWLSFAGAAAYALSSFTLISIEAGHINKVFDMALMAPVLGGIVFAYRGKYLLGAAVTALFLCLQIFYGHVQITYYLIILVAFYIVAQFIQSIIEKTLPTFFKASAILVLAAFLAVIPNISQLWVMSEYVKSTTRGGSELTTMKKEGEGLDKEYALAWSNGISETMTLFIPYFYGGGSHENLGRSSEIYKVVASEGQPKAAKEVSKTVPLYWGDQPFTSGPVYFGALVCFLFILGLFIVKGNVKWWILGATILSIMLSWGKNLEWFTDIFFYYVPLYNKFRSVTMILSIAQVTVPLLAILAIKEITSENIDKEKVLKSLKWSVIIMGGIALICGLFGGSFFDFTNANDQANLQQMGYPDWLQKMILDSNALEIDRASKLRTDSLRSLFFVLAGAGLIWLLIKEKVTQKYFIYAGLALLMIVDLSWVDKRYLNNDDFKFRKNFEKEVYVKNSADEAILADPDLYFRVFNLTKNPTQDAVTSYYHKSLGGYSAIKLRRYQDIIDSAIYKNNQSVINMLNTKYYIGQTRQGEVVAEKNLNALGNAWVVGDYKFVKNADEEIKAIQHFDPAQTAIVDEKFKDQLKGKTFTKDPSAKITLTSYHPNRLSYKSNASSEQLAVFSEIYYQPGWNAYVDGKLVPHFRVNYILRAMVIPAGEHKIDFKFEPRAYEVGEKISLAGSIGLVIFLLLVFGREIYMKIKE